MKHVAGAMWPGLNSVRGVDLNLGPMVELVFSRGVPECRALTHVAHVEESVFALRIYRLAAEEAAVATVESK